MRMVPLIVESGVPSEILRGDFHLLGNHIPLRAEEMHPCICVVIAQPLGIFPAEGDDVYPDITGVFIHIFLYL
jgi:hypothetical protein